MKCYIVKRDARCPECDRENSIILVEALSQETAMIIYRKRGEGMCALCAVKRISKRNETRKEGGLEHDEKEGSINGADN